MPGQDTTSSIVLPSGFAPGRRRSSAGVHRRTASLGTPTETRVLVVLVQRSDPLPNLRATGADGAELLCREVADGSWTSTLCSPPAVCGRTFVRRHAAKPAIGARSSPGSVAGRLLVQRRRISAHLARSSCAALASTAHDLRRDACPELVEPILFDDVLHAGPAAVLPLAVADAGRARSLRTRRATSLAG
jgi:hypothetical protein